MLYITMLVIFKDKDCTGIEVPLSGNWTKDLVKDLVRNEYKDCHAYTVVWNDGKIGSFR